MLDSRDAEGGHSSLLPVLAASLLASCGAGVAGVVAASSGSGGGNAAPVLTAFEVVTPKVSRTRLRLVASQPVRVALFLDAHDGQGQRPLTNLEGLPGNEVNLPAGETVLDWDFAAQLGPGFTPLVQLFARRPGGATIDGGEIALGLGNDPPVIHSVAPPAGESSGVVPIGLLVSDTSADVVSLAIEWRRADEPSDAWKPARAAGVFPAGVETSPGGVELTFIWDTDVDLADEEQDVVVRVTGDDRTLDRDDNRIGVGEPVERALAIDNNDAPVAALDSEVLVTSPDETRAIAVPLTVVDAESDPVDVVLQWRRDGEEFPDLSTFSRDELRALRDDPGRADERRELHVCSEAPIAFRGRALPPPDGFDPRTSVTLPELASTASALVARDRSSDPERPLAGQTLELLRPPGELVRRAESWAQKPQGPVAALPVGNGPTALVLDVEAPGSWRLREIDLATGEPSAGHEITGEGDPSAMAMEPEQRSVVVASDLGGDWRVERVELASWAPTALVRAGDAGDLTGERGRIRSIAPLGNGASVITLGSSLVRLDYEVLPEPGPPAPSASGFSSSALAPFPRAVTLLTDLSEPWGVVSDPLASHSIYLAERTFPRADGGVGRVSHVELDSYIRRAVFLAPSTPLEGGFERPTAIALEAHGARLLALTDALGDDDRELRGIEIGGRAPGVVFEPARELGTAASLATGPDGLRLVALPTENDLAVAGGVEQRRTIAGYDRARAVVAVSEPFEPAPRANAPWRIEGTLAAAPSSPQGRSSVFVWDSADVLEADVFLRVVPLDTDRGLGDDSLVAKRVRAFGDPAVLITGNSLNVDAADVNGDGRLDLVSTGTRFSGPPSGVLVYLQLQGPSGGFDPSPSLSFGIGRGWSWARAEDLDGDGDTDLVGMRSTKHEGGDLFGGAGEDPTTVDALLVFLQPVTGFIGADPEAGRPGQAPDYRLGLALPQKLDDTQQFDVADFDRNGRLDLVLACASVGITRPIPPPVGAVALWYGGTPDLYSANPDELLRSEIRFETWVRQTSSSDMNGDGLLDLVLPTRLGIDVRFQHPDGGPPSGPPELFSIRDLLLASDPGPAPGCFAGDANGDGRIDLVSHGIGAGGDGDLEIYFQGGAGLAGDSMASSLGRHGGGYGVAADVDGDGRQDLVLPGFAQNRVEILLQSGRGRFPSGSSNVLLPVQFPSGVVTPDLNGDGRLDLAVAQFDGPNTLTVWQAGAPGRFAATPDQALTTFGQIGRPVSLAAADLDGDGRQDLVAAGADHSGSFGQSPGGLGLYHQRSSGTYSSVPDSIVHARASGFRALVAADLDGDGRVDLACANAGPRNLTVFLQGEGDPAFADEPTQVLGGPLVTRDPRGLTAADLDGDGSLDLVSADNASDDLTVFYQKPTGFADKPVRLGGGVATDGPGTLAAADLDSDGRVDLAVADANGRNGAVFYQPPGGFVSPGPPAVLLQATRPVIYIAVQDVDGDGLLDMILQSSGLGGLGGVLVFYQPRPRFHSTSTAGVEIPFAGTGSVLRATDLDGNGSVDVALASTRDSEAGIHLFFQRPSGFPASADLVLAKEPVNLHVDLLAADLSGDGEIDLASVLQRSPRPDGVVADQILLFFSGK